jgi:hypothetical protein
MSAWLRLLRHPLDPGRHWVLPVWIRRRRIVNFVMRRYGNRATDAG